MTEQPLPAIALRPRSAALRERLVAAEEASDPRWLGTDEAIGDLEALQRELMADPDALIVEYAVLGVAYLYRLMALRGADELSLGAAVFLLLLVYQQAPELVPE